MEGWQVYSKIQEMKGQGFSIRQVSRAIRVSRNTIRKYWEMPPAEYAEAYRAVNRVTALTAYEPAVLRWMEAHPSMTAAQVRDWLEEKYSLDAAERTVRRFVARLRDRHGIARKDEPVRVYEAVDELPMGRQLQLDFGEKTVRHAYSSRYIRLRFAVFTLSYSRYKWGVFQDRPFLSADLVRALYGCFDYFGGMPAQLVYDQDSVIVVSENGGDIVHTQAFAAFLADSKLEVRVCRKSDPETKGRVESSVKFVKGNFMENRLYMGLDIWNRAFEDWLVRTGNGKEHGTTKRRPSDMFAEEQGHLLPLFGAAPAKIAEEMDRTVRADNTVLYKSNRYSLPLGTYGKAKAVFLAVEGGSLKIMDRAGELLATHQIGGGKGGLVKLDAHRRDRGARAKERLDRAVALLGEEFREYLAALCQARPRYEKEQLDLVVQACETYGRGLALEAARRCQGQEVYSAGALCEAAAALGGQPAPQGRLPASGERYHIRVQKRPLSAYAEAAGGKGGAQ
jgi:transposase